MGRPVLASVPYFVAAYTGGPGAAAFAIPDSRQPATQTTYDGLGRTTGVQIRSATRRPPSRTECGWDRDSACYEVTIIHDPLMHQSMPSPMGWGGSSTASVDTGNEREYLRVVYEYHYTYDASGQLTRSSCPTMTRRLHLHLRRRRTHDRDDRPRPGHESYAYDADGNVTQTTDARGSSGTIYAGL